MNILALDLGIKTGWALQEHRSIESGVQIFDVKRGESPGMRYLRFNRWLEDITWDAPSSDLRRRIQRIHVICYEQSHHRGGAATEVAAGFTTRVQEFCARHGIEHHAVHSATLKKFTTGRGNAKKPDMISAVLVRGWANGKIRHLDENEADALALLHYALAELLPQECGA